MWCLSCWLNHICHLLVYCGSLLPSGTMIFQYAILLVVLPAVAVCVLICATCVLIPLAFAFASWYMRVPERKRTRRIRDGANVAFFHPYCTAGGGGERVLWVAIKALLTRYPDCNIFIYTVEANLDPQAVVNKVHNIFNVTLDANKIHFIQLSMRSLIEASTYPYFTLLLQSLGSVILGLEAFMKLNPDVYLETTGFAFTLPIFKYMARCPTGTYTHYPTVTAAMMRRVQRRVVAHNNTSLIARNPLLTWCKLLYYRVFAWAYGVAGRCADIVMVNGSWTEEHINELWKVPLKTHRVYPPCEVSELKKLRSLVHDGDDIRILSVAQFRPEKDHPLMLQAMYQLRELLVKNEALWGKIKLVLVGSCRGAADEERVRNLRDLAAHLALDASVQFHVNVTYARLLELYQTSALAMHAMWNEHFGIGVVECMAAGLITIAHRSGGPLCDIVQTSEGARSGFLAGDADEYAHAVLEAIALRPEERRALISAARASVDRFSTAEFEKGFLRAIEPLMKID